MVGMAGGRKVGGRSDRWSQYKKDQREPELPQCRLSAGERCLVVADVSSALDSSVALQAGPRLCMVPL